MNKQLFAWLALEETRQLITALPPHAFRFVGGCVRDSLLGIPVKDIDIATALLPEDVMALLAKSHIKTMPTGIKHGTVTAIIRRRSFEITTLRRDTVTDGRHAEVAYTDDWQEDAKRRDFTMNALYCDVWGNITDYWGGVQDAKEGRVRFIGEAAGRIEEDYLRILRFFRFSALYAKGEYDAKAIAACAHYADKIATLSGERIAAEMFKLLMADKSATALHIMQENALLVPLTGEKVNPACVQELARILHFTRHAPDPRIALALLIRSAANAQGCLNYIHKRWKLSLKSYRFLHHLCIISHDNRVESDKTAKVYLRQFGKALFHASIVVLIAEGADKAKGLATLALAEHWQAPVFPITGNMLIAKGLKPGKAMGSLLKNMEMWWEEQEYIPDTDTLLEKFNESLTVIV